jgi:diadenosine tetraphosphate (Ap4A) HIT family hydrolase
MTSPECPFCRKLAGLAAPPPEEVVWQFPHSVALLGEWQFYRGYCLLVARTHATELSRLPDAERRAYLDEMCLLARAIEECYRPHKLNYELLGNQVPHLHWHLFPRSAGDADALRPVWLALVRAERDEAERRRLAGDPRERAATAAALRQALARLADGDAAQRGLGVVGETT